MKINPLFLTVLSLLFFSVTAFSQSAAPALTAYYGVKNALVATDGMKAKAQAATLVSTLGKVDVVPLKADEKKALASAKSSALFVSKTADVAAQRKEFAALSNSMIALAKATKPAKTYVQYCPMKKASWLSESKDVKNPYYGTDMLTCGSTKEVIE